MLISLSSNIDVLYYWCNFSNLFKSYPVFTVILPEPYPIQNPTSSYPPKHITCQSIPETNNIPSKPTTQTTKTQQETFLSLKKARIKKICITKARLTHLPINLLIKQLSNTRELLRSAQSTRKTSFPRWREKKQSKNTPFSPFMKISLQRVLILIST